MLLPHSVKSGAHGNPVFLELSAISVARPDFHVHQTRLFRKDRVNRSQRRRLVDRRSKLQKPNLRDHPRRSNVAGFTTGGEDNSKGRCCVTYV